MRDLSSKIFPILASTGAAAVLLGGRTFHSFFGLGILEGGPVATLDRALKDMRLLKRIHQVEGIIIDEISMIPGVALEIAEQVARKAKDSPLPWGGLRVIAVGDFGQLPPITKNGAKRDWCFLSETWARTNFITYQLQHNQRVQDLEFLDVLSDVRKGQITERVKEFLSERKKFHDEDHPGPRLFPRREQSELYNQKKLSEINEDEHIIDSIYLGEEKFVTNLKRSSPVPEQLKVKVGCRVLFLKNDPQKRWVNGTRGVVTDLSSEFITVRKESQGKVGDPASEKNANKLIETFGREVKVEKIQFSLLDADGNMKASVIQFPLALAYATTIHKSQGATLDEVWCDLGSLWEPGHAYVALSRLRSAEGLHIVRWSPRSFIVDPLVENFYKSLER